MWAMRGPECASPAARLPGGAEEGCAAAWAASMVYAGAGLETGREDRPHGAMAEVEQSRAALGTGLGRASQGRRDRQAAGPGARLASRHAGLGCTTAPVIGSRPRRLEPHHHLSAARLPPNCSNDLPDLPDLLPAVPFAHVRVTRPRCDTPRRPTPRPHQDPR